ncbi:MAG: hypothetical protein DRN27_07700 [Thermoplasmata archaeon]|nr:MAG: hypothetical protein DRN27_07700 [Thermoplasmata archaeon]
MAKTSMNMEENMASLLCYLLTWLTGIIFYLVEKENKTVRFHALQSILTFLPLTILGYIFQGVLGVSYTTHSVYGYAYGVPTLSPFYYVGLLIYALTAILWLVLVIKAYQGQKFKLPIVGDIAEKHA